MENSPLSPFYLPLSPSYFLDFSSDLFIDPYPKEPEPELEHQEDLLDLDKILSENSSLSLDNFSEESAGKGLDILDHPSTIRGEKNESMKIQPSLSKDDSIPEQVSFTPQVSTDKPLSTTSSQQTKRKKSTKKTPSKKKCQDLSQKALIRKVNNRIHSQNSRARLKQYKELLQKSYNLLTSIGKEILTKSYPTFLSQKIDKLLQKNFNSDESDFYINSISQILECLIDDTSAIEDTIQISGTKKVKQSSSSKDSEQIMTIQKVSETTRLTLPLLIFPDKNPIKLKEDFVSTKGIKDPSQLKKIQSQQSRIRAANSRARKKEELKQLEKNNQKILLMEEKVLNLAKEYFKALKDDSSTTLLKKLSSISTSVDSNRMAGDMLQHIPEIFDQLIKGSIQRHRKK